MGKYNAKKVIVDGIEFDSQIEAKRYVFLKHRQNEGYIKELKLQPVFVIQEPFRDIAFGQTKKGQPKSGGGIKYIADFRYRMDGFDIVEDVKGMRTQAYIIKRSLFIKRWPSIYHVEITEKNRLCLPKIGESCMMLLR